MKEGGILSPLVASLAQWHLLDNPEQDLGSGLTEALKATLREADGLKRALGQVRSHYLDYNANDTCHSRLSCRMNCVCGAIFPRSVKILSIFSWHSDHTATRSDASDIIRHQEAGWPVEAM